MLLSLTAMAKTNHMESPPLRPFCFSGETHHPESPPHGLRVLDWWPSHIAVQNDDDEHVVVAECDGLRILVLCCTAFAL